jgi:iron complex outermembrane receptor protein
MPSSLAQAGQSAVRPRHSIVEFGRGFWWSLLFAVFLPLVTPGVYGQARAQNAQALKKLSVEQLGEIEVATYSKMPSQLLDTPAAVYVITSEQIRRSGATSIADALRLAPGVEVGRYSSDSWAVGIRGLENDFSKSVLVLIDGRNVYTPLLAGVYWDVQDVPLDDIDRIEVIRGPGGTVWGPNAGNGVINIITKNSRDTHGVTADALVGNEDQFVGDVRYGASARRSDYRLFGRGFARHHEYHSNGINDDNWHQERFGFRFDRSQGPETYFVSGDLYKGDSPQILGTTPWDTRVSGGDINARWEHNLSGSKGFYLQGYVARALRSGVPVDEARNTYDIDFIHHFGVGGRNLFSYGGTLHWSPYQVSQALFSSKGGTDYEHTGFVQDEIRVGTNVWITAGTKLEFNNYSGFDLQPSGRILWASSDRQALWGGVTRAVTTPSDLEENYDLRESAGNILVQVLGNHSFKSEDVIGYEAGYRRLLVGKVYGAVSTFWNQYSRLQSFSVPAVSSSGGLTSITVQYQNQISGSTSGGELATDAQIANWWHLNANYSFLSSDFAANGPTADISSTGSVRTYDGSSPKHMLMVQSMFDLPGHIQFDPMYRFISALPAQKVPAYQTMDVHLEKQLGRNVAFELVGQNLFQNRHYEWGTGDPTQPLVGIYRAGYVRLIFHSDR